MDQTATILQAIADLSRAVAAVQSTTDVITAEMEHINEHFARLNGSVARHEAALTAAGLEAARVAGVASARATWERRLLPIIWAAIAVGTVLVLQKADVILRAVAAGH